MSPNLLFNLQFAQVSTAQFHQRLLAAAGVDPEDGIDVSAGKDVEKLASTIPTPSQSRPPADSGTTPALPRGDKFDQFMKLMAQPLQTPKELAAAGIPSSTTNIAINDPTLPAVAGSESLFQMKDNLLRVFSAS